MQYVESSCAVQECRTIPHGNITAIERKGEITMKSTGVVRQLDTLGRIVLPIELRRTMDIGVKDMLEIFVEGDEIILTEITSKAMKWIFSDITDNSFTWRSIAKSPAGDWITLARVYATRKKK